MSSDDAYMTFLKKANSDIDADRFSQQGASSVRTETVDASVQVPAPLQSVDEYYISETDEPFEPVALRWEGAKRGTWPNAGTLWLAVTLPYTLYIAGTESRERACYALDSVFFPW